MKYLRLFATIVALIACTQLRADYLTGSCGEKLTYTLNTETGNLNIEGSGAMKDYESPSYAPWYDYRDLIHTVTLSPFLKSIGSFAFLHCKSLTSIYTKALCYTKIVLFGDSVQLKRFLGISITNIEERNAVLEDWSMVGTSITSIGKGAFWGCSSLTSIIIPKGVTSIGTMAFWFCPSLKTVIIPNSVTSIEELAFGYCSSLTSITIPKGVTSIGKGTFNRCKSLTSVTIPNSVTSIEEETFRDCEDLTSVTIPNSVTSIGSFAFRDCI